MEFPQLGHRPSGDPIRGYLSEKTVAVLGSGSVGGLATWFLSGAGLGELRIVDRDFLSIDNVRRHIGSLNDVGSQKVQVVESFVKIRFPTIHIEFHRIDLFKQPACIESVIADADAVLVAVDCEATKHLIDRVARKLRVPVVYVGVYGNGWGIETIVCRGLPSDYCYACAARSIGRIGICLASRLPRVAYSGRMPQSAVTEWHQADLLSVAPAAAFASQRVVEILLQQHGRLPCEGQLLGGVSAVWQLPLRRGPLDGQPWELIPVKVQRLPGCPNCDAPRDEHTTIAELLKGETLS
jgi:hypothetical protein